MVFLFLLLLLQGEKALVMKNGRVLYCRDYERKGEDVLVHGKETYSLPSGLINWPETERRAAIKRQTDVTPQQAQKSAAQEPSEKQTKEEPMAITAEALDSFKEKKGDEPQYQSDQAEQPRKTDRSASKQMEQLSKQEARFQKRYDDLRQRINEKQASLDGYREQLSILESRGTYSRYNEERKAYYRRKISERQSRIDSYKEDIRQLEREAKQAGVRLRRYQ